jgi:aerobic C4-dicarboxylate transport protein
MAVAPHRSTIQPATHPWWRQLYFQVIGAIVLGAAVGHFYPDTGAALKPLAMAS